MRSFSGPQLPCRDMSGEHSTTDRAEIAPRYELPSLPEADQYSPNSPQMMKAGTSMSPIEPRAGTDVLRGSEICLGAWRTANLRAVELVCVLPGMARRG